MMPPEKNIVYAQVVEMNRLSSRSAFTHTRNIPGALKRLG